MRIGEHSSVPLTWVFALVGAVAALALYVSRIDGRAEAAHEKATDAKVSVDVSIERFSATQETILYHAQSMDRRLSRIEGALNGKEK